MASYSAKTRLLEQKEIARRHLDVVASEAFLRAAEAALIEVVMTSPDPANASEAFAAYYRIIGARDYLKALLNVAEPPKLPTPKPNYGLDRNPA